DHDHADDGRGQVQRHPRPGELLGRARARTRRARARPGRAAAGGDVVIVVTRTGRLLETLLAVPGRAVGVLGVRVLRVRVLGVAILARGTRGRGHEAVLAISRLGAVGLGDARVLA